MLVNIVIVHTGVMLVKNSGLVFFPLELTNIQPAEFWYYVETLRWIYQYNLPVRTCYVANIRSIVLVHQFP